MKAYKVTRLTDGRHFSTCVWLFNSSIVEYVQDVPSVPNLGCGSLVLFARLEDAKKYAAKGHTVWEADYEPAHEACVYEQDTNRYGALDVIRFMGSSIRPGLQLEHILFASSITIRKKLACKHTR